MDFFKKNFSASSEKGKEHLQTVCPDCGASLYREFDGIVLPSPCKCREEELVKNEKNAEIERKRAKIERINKLFDMSKIGRRFSSRTFDTFDKSKNENAFGAALDYVENFDEHFKNGSGLIILGPVGTGKTHLAASIAVRLMHDHLHTSIFTSLIALLEKLRNSYDKKADESRSEAELLDALERSDLLVIDDIGHENWSAWTSEKVFQIINSRYESMLPVIITSNLNVTELSERIGEATFDRLLEINKIVYTEGTSYRKTIARAHTAPVKNGGTGCAPLRTGEQVAG